MIFSRVKDHVEKRVKERIVPTLKKYGIHVWGVIPESTVLTAPTVREIVDVLGG